MKIVFATNNAHKLSEIRSILGESIEVLSLKEEPTPAQQEVLDAHRAVLADVRKKVNQMTAGVPLNRS